MKKVAEKALLTTSEAAELLCVTPDAVRKWVQFGQLNAVRTPGGHYRIPRDTIVVIREMKTELQEAEVTDDVIKYCWEYCQSAGGEIDSDCQTCLTYRSKTLCCFELNVNGVSGTNTAIHCKTDCDKCEYAKYLQEILATRELKHTTTATPLR